MAASLPLATPPTGDPVTFLKPWIRAFVEEVMNRGLDRLDFQLARFGANRNFRNFRLKQKGCGMRLDCRRCGAPFKTTLVREN